jgi:hypothetical protein
MGPNQILKPLAMKITFLEDDLTIPMVEYLSNPFLDLAHILNLRLGEQTRIAVDEDDLLWKTTSNNKSEISQQQLIKPFSTFKLKPLGPNQN